jgi:hypothetical protein
MNFRIELQIIKKYLTTRNVFLLIGVLFIFFMSLRPPIDPDMGWHLMDGEYLFSHNFQAAHRDIFSFTMPNFPLIMHEWMTEIAMYFIYSNWGLLPLSLFFAIVTTSAFLLATFGVRAEKEHKIIAAMLAVIAGAPIIGVRPQMVNLLGLALTIYLIFGLRKDREFRGIYFLPLIFAVWVNSHAGFAVGLFFLAVFLCVELGKLIVARLLGRGKKEVFLRISEKIIRGSLDFKVWLKLVSITAVSVLATLLNPYGWKIYIEVFSTIFDQYSKKIISEWLPVTVHNPMSWQFLIYLALFLILVLFSWRRLDYTYFLVTLPFLLLGFSSWRHMPIFLIVSTPLWVNIVESVSGKELLRLVNRWWILTILLILIILVAKQQVQQTIPRTLSVEKLAENNYPWEAVEYLKANPQPGNMLNEYNWGGFLIWQYPEKKVFIDGRMPSWKMGDLRIFESFSKIMSGEEGWSEELAKYDVSFALVYNNDFNKRKFRSIGWKEVFRKGPALIMKRPNQD